MAGIHAARSLPGSAALAVAALAMAALAAVTLGCAPAGTPPEAAGPRSAAAPAQSERPAADSGGLPVDDDQWTARFDDHFRKYSKRFFSVAFDWRWFKAQGITESALRERATSPVGARGIMQIMPATFAEIAAQSSLPIADIEEPRQNIAAAVFYDRRLYDLWDDIPERRQRLAFTFASYNGGRSRVLRAQDRCETACAEWARVAAHVPEETRDYVARIMRLMAVDL